MSIAIMAAASFADAVSFGVHICSVCEAKFPKRRMGQKVCGPRCAAKAAKAERQKERRADKARKEAIKTIPQLKKEAQTAFNAFIRERDKDQPCISCGAPPKADYGYHGGRDAGHYRSTGSADHMRFHQDNCHAQCVKCNQWGSGMAVDYRIGLVKRIGVEAVEALEANNQVVKWNREYLIAMKAHFMAELKELKKAGD